MPEVFWNILIFVFGAGIGSFINVVSMRYQPDGSLFGPSIKGRSHCRSCGKVLGWYELLPIISFLIQTGRCRGCRKPLSFQYPLIEVITGLVFVFLPLAVGNAYEIAFHRIGGGYPSWYCLALVLFYIASASMILLAAIDHRLRIIPDELNLILAVIGIILGIVIFKNDLLGVATPSFLGFYASVFGLRGSVFWNLFAASFFSFSFFGVVYYLSRGRAMGFGDVKFAGVLGILLGWPDIVIAIVLAFITGAFWSIILMSFGKKRFKSVVPFGPFIALGALIVVFWGRDLMDFYFRLFPN